MRNHPEITKRHRREEESLLTFRHQWSHACPARRCQHCDHPVVVDPICSSVSGEDATQETERVRRRYSRTACGDPWWGQVERDEDGDDGGGCA